MNRASAPVQRANVTPFGTSVNRPRWPVCGSTDLLPLSPTAEHPEGSYCVHCPWTSRNPRAAGTPRPIGSTVPSLLHLDAHQQRRQADRARSAEAQPTKPLQEVPGTGHLSKLERLQVAGVTVLGLVVLAGLLAWGWASA